MSQSVAGAAMFGGLSVGIMGEAGSASAEPMPPPPPYAPPRPVDPIWADGNPQIWDRGWNHWGVWLNGVFVPTF
ncbi:hypothetical protein [Mycobacterium yunnanensis]|nr:hypothetical protein [Mycobacterium yunnanensis]